MIAVSPQRLRCALAIVARPRLVGAALAMAAAPYGAFWLFAPVKRPAAAGFGVALLTSFILAGIAAPALALMAQAARQFCLPGLNAYVRRLLWAIVFLLVMAPWLLSLDGALGSPWWRLAVLCCVVAASFVYVLVPAPLAFCLPLVPILSGWAEHLGRNDPPGSTAKLFALSLALTLIASVAWRRLILAEHLSATSWASLAELHGRNLMVMSRARYGSNVSASQMPRWLLPRSSARAARSAIARMRTVLGPPFAPGSMLRTLAFLLLLLAAFPLVMFLLPVTAPLRPIPPVILSSPITLGVGLSVGFMAQFPVRLMALYRPNSAELAELALLPGCGAGTRWRRDYVAALLIPQLQLSLAFGAALGVAGALIHQTAATMVGGALTFMLTFCLQALMTLYCVLRGRMPVQSIVGGPGLWIVVVVLIVNRSAANAGATLFASGTTGRVWAVGVLLCLVAGTLALSRRWYHDFLRLPYPIVINEPQ